MRFSPHTIKMRGFPLTAHQRCRRGISLWLRIGFRAHRLIPVGAKPALVQLMQNCTAAILIAQTDLPEPQNCATIAAKRGFSASLHSGNKLIEKIFASAIKRFPPAIPVAHDKIAVVRCAIRTAGIGGARRSVKFAASISTKGDVAVDLALKFDVLAVCAVFVFVGAILLGAF
jgi:hypothetical protein